jgi:hypothetical protein
VHTQLLFSPELEFVFWMMLKPRLFVDLKRGRDWVISYPDEVNDFRNLLDCIRSG